ncbi:MAG: ATP-binding protein [Defluviitaleaceae bacterium]|nr:ATP-binding protein [Defluviitaleaceae bacterium]
MPKQESSLGSKSRFIFRTGVLYFGIPVLVIILLLFIGSYITRVISDDFARRFARQYSIEAAANFLTATNSHFVLGQQLANSTTISRWLANEFDEDIKSRAIEEIMGYSAHAEHIILMFTAYDSLNVYDLRIGFTADDFAPGWQVERDAPWFSNTIFAELPFNINIQRSRPVNGTWEPFVWTNHRMYYLGHVVGVVTAGSPFQHVFDAVFDGYCITDRRGYIIDYDGLVRVDSAEILQVLNDGISSPAEMPEALENYDLAEKINAHLQTKINGAFRLGGEPVETITISGDFRYAGIVPIIGTNWSVVVLTNPVGVFDVLFIPMILATLIVLFVSLITGLIIKTQSAEITKAEEKMSLIIDNMPFVANISGRDSVVTECNDAGPKLFGLRDKQEYMERFFELQPEFQPDGRLSMERALEEDSIAFDKGTNCFDWMHKHINGELIPCEVTLICVKWRGEQKLLSFVRDLREYHESKRLEIAEESNKAKTRFLARMSHEIRTPITAVLGISEIQIRNANLPPETEESFVKIYDSAQILLSIVNDILDFSKIESGKMDVPEVEYDVVSLVSEVAQLQTVYLEYKNIIFRKELEEDLPTRLFGGILRIRQIMSNLISNAIKYTESGSVTLSLGCERGAEDNLTLLISVRDTGRGMTPAQLEAARTGEYSRFHEREERSAAGTGLGIPIVYSLVQLMNGSIEFESKPGHGTHVLVRIPQKIISTEVLGKNAATILEEMEAGSRHTTKKLKFVPEPMPYGKVLVVDDVDANLFVARGLLAFYHLSVDTCKSGQEAIRKIENGKVYDIVFMDHMMPGLNGIDTMLIMRNIGYAKPIVVLTANALVGQAEEFIKTGFDDFVSKPISAARLNDVLVKYISRTKPPEVASNSFDEFFNNPEITKRLRAEFLKRYKDSFAEMSDALKSGNNKAAHLLAHSVKSAAGLINENNLAAIAENIENSLRQGNIPDLSAFKNELAEAVKRVSVEYLVKSSGNAPGNAGAESLSEILNSLKPLLETKNIKAQDFLGKLRLFPEAVEIAEKIENYDYKAALKTLETLKESE